MDMNRLRSEVDRLRNIEAMRDILVGEVQELRKDLNNLRMEYANLKDISEGLVEDLNLMEATIRELHGAIPDEDGFDGS
jgi:uncharacterized coiled-coil DUF342 family protein